MKQPDIKNCPYCQSEQVKLDSYSDAHHWVECRGECEMSGPLCLSAAEAVTVWNEISFGGRK